jgi:putative transposase
VKLREEVRWLGEHYQASQQRICGLMEIAVSSYRYRSTRSDAALRERLVELARKKPRFGYRRLHILLTGSGERVNHKRVFRVYRESGLAVRRKARKRLVREGSPRPALTGANQEWALDFVHDAVASGRAIRVLTVEDEYT